MKENRETEEALNFLFFLHFPYKRINYKIFIMEVRDLLGNVLNVGDKIVVAEINSQAEMAILQLKNHMTVEDELNDGVEPDEYSQEAKDRLMEQMREFDERLKLDRY